jgi:hypothetical protein
MNRRKAETCRWVALETSEAGFVPVECKGPHFWIARGLDRLPALRSTIEYYRVGEQSGIISFCTHYQDSDSSIVAFIILASVGRRQ